MDNSNTAEKTWGKISSQLSSLIDNYRVMPEKEFQTIVEEQVHELVILKENEEKKLSLEEPETSKSKKEKNHNEQKDSQALTQDQSLIQERKNEIERLKNKISSQMGDIWSLKESLSKKLLGSNITAKDDSESFELINRHLKDAELCISIMDNSINAQEIEISELKDQLKAALNQVRQLSSTELQEEIKSKDALIARFSQESKEMLTLLDGMEKGDDEQREQIRELESIKQQLQDKVKSLENKDVPNNATSTQNMDEEINKRDKLISKFAQDSKRMLSIIHDLEIEKNKNTEQIKSLEKQLLSTS